jgi:hypothetical protein
MMASLSTLLPTGLPLSLSSLQSGGFFAAGLLEKRRSNFLGTSTPHYVFFSVIEIAATAVVVWLAWTWRREATRPALAQAGVSD